MRRTSKKSRRRERPLGAAVGMGVAVTLGLALAIFLALFLTPHSALRTFYDVVAYNMTSTLPYGELYQRLSDQLFHEDAWITLFVLFCGGLTVGRLAPSRAGRRRTLLASGGMALGISLASKFPLLLTFYQSSQQARQGGHSPSPLFDPQLLMTIFAWLLLWIVVCVLGAYLGLLWRDAARKKAGRADSTPAPLQATPR